MQLASIFKLMRPHQYIKNLFIFLPIFFAIKISDIGLLSSSFLAFIAFSLTASAVYALNDYKDIEEDRQHPKKKDRPLASGSISKSQAIAIMAALAVLGGTLMAFLSLKAFSLLAVYVFINIAYSFFLKHISIVDVNIIAIGFVFRLFIGSAVTYIHLSKWIVIMTFLLALFMALAKRRDDVLIFLNTGKKMRKVIDGYNLQFLDAAMAAMAAVIVVAYILYTTSAEVAGRISNQYLYLTSFFVILGVLHYLKITFVSKDSGSPTKIIIKDRFMQLILLGWFASFTFILYS
ncbi:UbiA prenyltransferase family protein [Oceanospirillaceae bacterium]|nr:UbiA prenyltransferase family protein [Oceanospirillaceae bacterium]